MELLACFGICYGTNYIYHHKAPLNKRELAKEKRRNNFLYLKKIYY